jgi:hypothetical protein
VSLGDGERLWWSLLYVSLDPTSVRDHADPSSFPRHGSMSCLIPTLLSSQSFRRRNIQYLGEYLRADAISILGGRRKYLARRQRFQKQSVQRKIGRFHLCVCPSTLPFSSSLPLTRISSIKTRAPVLGYVVPANPVPYNILTIVSAVATLVSGAVFSASGTAPSRESGKRKTLGTPLRPVS